MVLFKIDTMDYKLHKNIDKFTANQILHIAMKLNTQIVNTFIVFP